MVTDKAVAGVKTEARPHPAGAAGAKLSGKEVAERAWKHRMSPRVREWAIKAIRKHNVATGTKRQQAQAILDEFRATVAYVKDPVMGETMATPLQTLCLDDAGGLCLLAGDCDDATITILALLMSIGIETMVILSSSRAPADVPTHVFGAFKDDLGKWVKLDGTTDYPVGQIAAHLKEWWIEPGAEAKEKGHGDFLGMADLHALRAAGLAGAFGVGDGAPKKPSPPRSWIDYRYPTLT